MALQTRKGAQTGATKRVSDRASELLAAQASLATEQQPEAHTIEALEGSTLTGKHIAMPAPIAPASSVISASTAPHVGSEAAPHVATRLLGEGGEAVVRELPVNEIARSPFQPKGRPSLSAISQVERAIQSAGSLQTLMEPRGAPVLSGMSPEAARLAELAADIATNGVETPIEVRTTDAGLEALKGHRRLAASLLAGRSTIPAINRGPLTNAAAAATVLRGNLHREDFTPWQEAVLAAEVRDSRKGDGQTTDVRSLATVLGWSHGKVGALLRVRTALSPEFLRRVGAEEAVIEDALAPLQYKVLVRLSNEENVEARSIALRRLIGLDRAPGGTRPDTPAYAHRTKRGGGFIIEVNQPIEQLDVGDVTIVKEFLESQLARVSARLHALGR